MDPQQPPPPAAAPSRPGGFGPGLGLFGPSLSSSTSSSSPSTLSASKHQIAGLYDLEETLGEGHYAVVKLARHVFTQEKVAVKVIDKMKLDAATRVQMLQEVQLMKLVQHPHVVRLYEVIDTQTKLYLVLEYADGGDMYDYIMRHEGGLQEEQAKRYFRQIVQAIQYCHKLHVVHRDLKPENVVFFERLGIVKLTDFGFSNQFNPGQRLQTSCGSLAYSAPEILLGDAYDAPAVDIWSLGVILYMLVCGSAPFQEANDSETLTMIMDCKYTFPKHITQNCRRLISRMLQRQPDSRASLQDIVNDPWVGGAADPEGNAIPQEEQLPLVSREHLTEEEHASILSRMVSGKIANKEDIIQALDQNEYNHITATYFLLAERKLRAQRQQLAHQLSIRRAERLALTGKGKSEESLTKIGTSKTMEDPQGDLAGNGRKLVTSGGPIKSSSTTDVLFSPEKEKRSLSSQQKRFGRMKNISIVEEEAEEEEAEEEEADALQEHLADVDDDEADVISVMGSKGRTLSHHSSTSSLHSPIASATSVASAAIVDIAALAAGLRAAKQMQAEPGGGVQESTPAPFPVSSHIGTGGLSRQGSLRRSDSNVSSTTTPAVATPTAEKPQSSSSSPNSGAQSAQGSPARYKMNLPSKKLVSTRSSPQLILNQIHEEAEDCASGGAASSPMARTMSTAAEGDVAEDDAGQDPVDAFPTSAAGAAVIRRLEQRRRLHKARAQSCSSSDASDDDSESRRKRHDKSRTPPNKRDSQHDDSSDSQDPGVGTSSLMTTSLSTAGGGGRGVFVASSSTSQQQTNTGTGSTTANGTKRAIAASSSSSTASSSSRRHRALQHHGSRIRQSHSLNRISELHVVADFSSDDISNNNSSCPSSVASIVNGSHPAKQFTPPQLAFDGDSDGSAPFDMLTRYLESLTVGRSGGSSNNNRSRDDSQNSSDGEVDSEALASRGSSRRHKVNLRVLEQRLNKIQEENNRSADEEEGEVDEDAGELSDDPSTLPDEGEAESRLENAKDDDDYDDDGSNEKRKPSAIIEIYNPKHFTQNLFRDDNNDGDEVGGGDETASIRSCDVTTLRRMKQRRKLHRAHSCGSLLGLKERALLGRNLPVLWDFLAAAAAASSTAAAAVGGVVVGNGVGHVGTAATTNGDAGGGRTEHRLTLKLASNNPLAVFQLQDSSRCCNLC